MWRMNQQMDHLLGGTRGPVSREYPLIEAWSGDDGMIIMANMPGVEHDAIDIKVDGRTLTLSGERIADEMTEDMRSYRRELASGTFSRSVELPFEVAVESVEASYENGVLEIVLPRVPEEKPRKITINGS
jgi:HSP20 family protein